MLIAELEEGDSSRNELYCNTHPGNKVSFLKRILSSNMTYLFESSLKCHDCFNEQSQSFTNFIPIDLFLSADENLIFSIYPFQNDEMPKKIKSALRYDTKHLIGEVEKIFKKYRVELLDKLEKEESKILQSVECITDIQKLIQKQYNQLTQKKVVKNILLEQKLSANEKDFQLTRLINTYKIDLTQKMNESLSKFNVQKEEMSKSISDASQVHSDLLKFCDSIQDSFKGQQPAINYEQLKISQRMAKIQEHLASSNKEQLIFAYQQLTQLQKNMSLIKPIQQKDQQDYQKSMEELCQLSMKFQLISNLIARIPGSIFGKYLLPIKIEKTRFLESSSILIRRDDLGIQLSLREDKIGQIVTPVLENQISYLIKIHFSHPIGLLPEDSIIGIGLIRDSQKDQKYIPENEKSGYITYENHFVERVIRGQQIGEESVRTNLQFLEFRFCIKNKILTYSDITYSNINQVHKKFFKQCESYRFGIYFENVSSEFKVTISECAEIDEDEINSF